MCGRFSQIMSRAELLASLPDLPQSSLDLFAEHRRSGLAPTDLAIVVASEGGRLAATPARFGFRISPTFTAINARSETVREKAPFRRGIESGRILVPMSGFYEFSRAGRRSIAHLFSAEAGPLLVAAILDSERSGMAILTREAREPVSSVHGRMPVALTPEGALAWLAEADLSGPPPAVEERRSELSSPSRDVQGLLDLDPGAP